MSIIICQILFYDILCRSCGAGAIGDYCRTIRTLWNQMGNYYMELVWVLYFNIDLCPSGALSGFGVATRRLRTRAGSGSVPGAATVYDGRNTIG